MASFKKLFRSVSSRSGGEVRGISSEEYFANSATSEPRTPALPYLHPSESLSKPDVNRQYDKIEQQFEHLHETFYSRTLTSLRQFRYNNSSDHIEQKHRSIDVIEALFSTHRYQMPTRLMSPMDPYNEDIADRNIIARNQPQVNSRLSTPYQDVADGSIAESKNHPKGPPSKYLNMIPDAHEGGNGSSRSKSHGRSSKSRTSHPSVDGPQTRGRDRTEKRLSHEKKNDMLKPQASAPDLGVPEVKTPDLASFPRPPTSGTDGPGEAPMEEKVSREEEKASREASMEAHVPANNSQVFSDSLARAVDKSRARRSSDAKSRSRTRGKRNVRALSIDTEITALKKPSVGIEHCAIPPPIPQNVPAISDSIDEIMHNHFLTVNSNPLTPRPSPPVDVDKVMKLLEQAYNSTPSPLYPTFESLQETIVREINSHDAFRSVPLKKFENTPPSSNNSFDESVLLPPPGPSRLKPLPTGRETSLSRLIRGRSNTGPRRKSLHLDSSSHHTDSSFPPFPDFLPSNYTQDAKPDISLSQKKNSLPLDVIPRRRRHTYGEPSTPSSVSFSITQPIPPLPQPETQPQSRRQVRHTASSASVSSASSFSLFPTQKPLPQARYKSHIKNKSEPVPLSPQFTEFMPVDSATSLIFPSYVR